MGGWVRSLKTRVFELTWRNDELTDPPGQRPDGFSEEHSMRSEITELDPPHSLAFTWGSTGSVMIELESQGDKVLLTLAPRRLPDRSTMLNAATAASLTEPVSRSLRVVKKRPRIYLTPFSPPFLRIFSELAVFG